MPIIVKVLEKDESVSGDTLTLGAPDENGQTIQLVGGTDDDLDALKTGQQYTLAFVPFVPPTNPVATAPDPGASAEDAAPAMVPTDHAAVIDPASAAAASAAAATPDGTAASDPGGSTSAGTSGSASGS
ncbi:MAG: hypothetical protein ACLQLG_08890 [Thermoguttaceae bacterium]